MDYQNSVWYNVYADYLADGLIYIWASDINTAHLRPNNTPISSLYTLVLNHVCIKSNEQFTGYNRT